MTGHSRVERLALRALAVAMAGSAAGGALAESEAPPPRTDAPAAAPVTPFSIGVSEHLLHDSNLFRQSSGEQADWTSSTALNLGIDQQFGRQRLHGSAALQFNRYRDHDELNNTGHDVGLQLDWETVNSLSGVLGVQSNRRQYQFGIDSGAPSTGLNIEQTQTGYFQGRLGGMGLWSLVAGANAVKRRYSDDLFAELNDFSQWAVEGGVGYRPSPDLGSTLMLRHTRISRPDSAQGPGDDVGRNELELGANWKASGASQFDAHLTRSHENHSEAADRDFWTGGIGWDWTPTGKLHLRTQLLRDTEGSNGGLTPPDPARPTTPAGDQLRDALQWTAQWELTSKINLTAGAQWSRRKLSSEVNNTVLRATDRTTAFTLGVRYAPLRSLDLGCDLASEKRNTNTTDVTLTRPYDAMAIGCTLQFWFR